MENLNKYDNEEVHLKKNLVRIGDLINMDGPMLVVFKDITSQDLYLFDWVDNDNKSNRWLVYKVDKNDLTSFLKRKISYRRLFEKNNNTPYFTDIDSEEFNVYKIFKLKEIPFEYRPDKDVLFDSNDSRNLDKIIKVLNLDNDLNEKDYSKEYNIIVGVGFMFEHAIQGNPSPSFWTEESNFVAINKQITRIYTHQNVSKSNRIPGQKRVAIQ